MDRANTLLQNLAQTQKTDPAFVDLCGQLIFRYGASPFFAREDGTTTFEIAVCSENFALVNLFVLAWLLVPSWKLHDEIYKIEENKVMLKYINDLVMQANTNSAIVNHILNIIHVYLVM